MTPKEITYVRPSNEDALDAADLLRRMLRCNHLKNCQCVELRPICEVIYEQEPVSQEDYQLFEKARAK